MHWQRQRTSVRFVQSIYHNKKLVSIDKMNKNLVRYLGEIMEYISRRQMRKKIAEYEERLKKAGVVVLGLEQEVLRLRRELKKRTDQYNDLVDLAIEKGVIDK